MKNVDTGREVIIITFDVGGQIYRIFKHLLEKFPNTLLWMAASDIKTNNEVNPIFIDRNSHRFQYVLDYIRNDSMLLDLPLTINREEFVKDMEYYGFPCDHDIYFPKDVKYIDGVQCHDIKWDVTMASPGIIFEYKNQIVKRDYTCEFDWKSVMGAVGFTTGTHYWSIQIMDDDNLDTMIGVVDKLIINKKFFPGYSIGLYEKGASYNGKTGNRHCKGSSYSFGPSVCKGDIIGTLLNMDRNTVTFYKNGVRIGTATDSGTLSGKKYYPCVSLSSHFQRIRPIGYNQIFPQHS